jgi:hypothetical protein
MERVGAPPALISTYSALDHLTFPVERDTGQVIATGAFAGTPSTWGGPEAKPPSLNPLGENPIATLRKVAAEPVDTVLFIVPLGSVRDGPLFVAVDGHRYPLDGATEVPSLRLSIAATSVPNRLLSAFSSSLLWLTLPSPRSIDVPLMLTRRDPSEQTYALAAGQIGQAAHPGEIDAPVSGAGVGTPVVAIIASATGTPAPAIAGFVESPSRAPTAFVPTSSVAQLLRSIATHLSGGE